MSDMSFDQLCELFNYTPKGRPLDPKECSEVLSVSVVSVACGPRFRVSAVCSHILSFWQRVSEFDKFMMSLDRFYSFRYSAVGLGRT